MQHSREKFLRSTLELSVTSLTTFFCVRYMWALAKVSEWGDESETIVASKMLAQGKELYTEISNPHGPATFIPGYLLELVGSYGVPGHRALVIIGQLVAVASIYYSPMLKSRWTKVVIANASLMLIATFGYKYLLNTYTYQAIAAILLTIIVAQLLARLPIESNFDNFKFWATVTGFSISTLPFLSVQYLPISFVLIALFGKRIATRHFWLGVLGGFCANLAFLIIHSSVNGFYALHIYMPTRIIPKFGGQEASVNLLESSIATVTTSFGLLAIFALSVFFYKLLAPFRFQILQVFLFAGTLLSLAVRPLSFHIAPFLVFGIVWIMLCSAFFLNNFLQHSDRSSSTAFTVVALWLIGIIQVSMFWPGSKDWMIASSLPIETDFSRAVDAYTLPSDEVLAFTFRSFEYIVSDRNPASAQYTYLAWQADYEKNPSRGVTFNLCQDISDRKPKLILMDQAALWNQSWESYAQCVIAIVEESYEQIDDKPIYVLK